MPYEHNLPAELNPEGDYCVPLYIPHHPDYTALLLGVLRTLEEVERYERDPNYDNENAKIVAANWRDRTLTPLIEAIATGAGMPRKFTLVQKSIGSNFTTSSTSPVAVTNSNIDHTFEFRNALIRCFNINMANGGVVGQSTLVEIEVISLTPIATGKAQVISTAKEMACNALYENITPGLITTIRLLCSVSANTATIGVNSFLVYEIEEWN